MQRRTVTLVAILSLLALSATVTSSASAEKLTLSEGGKALEPGTTIFLEGHNALGIRAERVECERKMSSFELFASVLTNSKKKDKLHINGFQGGDLPAPCRSFTGNADAGLVSLGEVLKLGADGEATVGPVEVRIFFEHEEYNGEKYKEILCVYRRSKLLGTNTATPTAQELGVEFGGNLPLRASLSSEKAVHLCPGEAEVSLTLPTTESQTGIIEEHVAP
jgi:hypothetical protein